MLSDLEQKVVDLAEAGYARWKIADELGVSERTVRAVIARLCSEYQCSLRDLPEVIRKENREQARSKNHAAEGQGGDPQAGV